MRYNAILSAIAGLVLLCGGLTSFIPMEPV